MESAAVPNPDAPTVASGTGVEDKGLANKLLHLTDRPVLVAPAEER